MNKTIELNLSGVKWRVRPCSYSVGIVEVGHGSPSQDSEITWAMTAREAEELIRAIRQTLSMGAGQ